jgi:hypothetical protein
MNQDPEMYELASGLTKERKGEGEGEREAGLREREREKRVSMTVKKLRGSRSEW